MPIRVQRKRTKGWRMPDNTLYVGRPTKWGNPYLVGTQLASNRPPLSAEDAMIAYGEAFSRLSKLRKLNIEELRGKNLACFCKLSEPCHADVLLEIANQGK